MTYQIGNITITAEELADMKRSDIDCKFWIKRIQVARAIANENLRAAIGRENVPYDIYKISLENELAAIGVKIL